MKQYLFALAGVVAATALASDPTPRPGDIAIDGFENYTTGASVATASNDWTGSADATVEAYATGEAPDDNIPPPFAVTDENNNYLAIDSGSDEVARTVNSTADTVYIDTLAQFSVLKYGETPPSADDAKILLWLQEDRDEDNGSYTYSTNLHVKGGYWDDVLPSPDYDYRLAKSCEPGVWYRVTITMYKSILTGSAMESLSVEESVPGFTIAIDNVAVTTVDSTFDDDILAGFRQDEYLPPVIESLIDAGTLIPSTTTLEASDPTVSEVAFKGTGAIDDLVVSANDPSRFMLTWPAGLTEVSYVLGSDNPVYPPMSRGYITISAATETPISLSGTIGNYTNTVTGTITAGGTLSLPDPGIVYFFPRTATLDQDGTAGHPYEIADVAGLKALHAAVTYGYDSGLCFVQTANIDMSSAGAWAGIGVYGDAALTHANARPFTGTYNGQGYKISNITFTDRDYAGVFNRVDGGTIKNLTVENIDYVGTGSKYCASIVGYALNGATLENLVSAGTFGLQEKPGKHNMAGIVIRVAGGTNTVNGTQVLNCTNNATIYGCYTKLAGICAISQEKHAAANNPKMVFTGCANNGELVLNRSEGGITGFAGIVGYSDVNTVMADCSNTGAITQQGSGYNTDCTGALIGMTYGHSITDGGTNSAPANVKMIGNWAGATEVGFLYATVANNVATTVLPPLAAGNTYLLEGNVAASETPVATLTAVGQTISFDTALGYTFNGTIANSGAAGIPIATTNGTVITYTAGYFPRTATADQDGSAEHPFELADADDIQALKAAFAANASWRSLNYKVVADIDATDLGYFDGIGTASGTNGGSGLCGGTLDGDGHTISNLKFSNAKYRGFFNQMNNHATIKNLTINVVDIQETDADEHGYAAFVGNMDSSTLLNCTATGTIGTTAKPSMHSTAGFAVKVNSAGVFLNCTNHVDIVCSLTDNPKVGGFVGLMQGGAFTNCWNDGDLTITVKTCGNDGNGVGGLVGYAQTGAYTISGGGNAGTIQSTDTTTAASTKYDIHVGTIVGKTGSALTAVDDVIAQADAVSAGVRANVNGLDFATVDNNVATFVSTLETNNTYKVMLGGATATYAFAAPGTIAFDTNLVQTVTFAITAAEGLTVTTNTTDGVVTYTAASPAPVSAYKIMIDGTEVPITPTAEDFAMMAALVPGLDTNNVNAVNTALATPIGTTGIPAWQAALLGLMPTEAGLAAFKVSSVSFNNDGDVVVTLSDAVTPKTGRGVDIALNLMGADTPSGSWSIIETADGTTFAPVTPASGETAKFYKVQAVFTATGAE